MSIDPNNRAWLRSGETLWRDANAMVVLQAGHCDEWTLLYRDAKRQIDKHTFFLDVKRVEPNTLMQHFEPDRWEDLLSTLESRIVYRNLRSHELAQTIMKAAFDSLVLKEGVEERELRRTLSKAFGVDSVDRTIKRLTGPYLAPVSRGGSLLRPTFLAVLDFSEWSAAGKVVDAAVQLFHERVADGFEFTFSISELCEKADVEPSFAWRTLDLALLCSSHGDPERLQPPRDIERLSQCGSIQELLVQLPEWSNLPANPSDPFHVDRPWIMAPAALPKDGNLPSIAGWQHAPYPSRPVIATPSTPASTAPARDDQPLLDPTTAQAFGARALELVEEVNACHRAKAYTAALVLIRRLLEGSIISVFEQRGEAEEIKQPDGDYKPLKALVNALCASNKVRVSKSTREAKDMLHAVRWLGGVAAHNRNFVASKTDAVYAVVLVSPVLMELASLLPSQAPPQQQQ